MSNLRHPGAGKELLFQILKQDHPAVKHHMNLPIEPLPKPSIKEVNTKEGPK
jgi:hypothetical protein